ncbi:hypothetical protein HDZ31DRAFT_36016 [Schizophyllum fasciatum]
MAALLDPTSAEYKKARKQHERSLRNRDAAHDWTPFRAAEKHYKARFPPPDLSRALDLATLDPARAPEIAAGGWRGSPSIDGVKVQRLDGDGAESQPLARAYTLPHIPGLVILPAFVGAAQQRALIRWAVAEHARPPTETNLDIHHLIPPEGVWRAWLRARAHPDAAPLMAVPKAACGPPASPSPGPRQPTDNAPASPAAFAALARAPRPPPAPSPAARPAPAAALLRRLRWASLGWSYHWGTKQYDFARGPGAVDARVRAVCAAAVRAVPWGAVFDGGEGAWAEEGGGGGGGWRAWGETYEPDAGIVNFYQTKDTLMGHVDRSEVCATSPLVSISLGNAAVFLIGGTTRDSAPTALVLRSGDVLIMAGPACRRAYHGVPRILDGTLPPHLRGGGAEEWAPFAEYMQTTRVNVNVRQVFPKGFDPSVPQGSDPSVPKALDPSVPKALDPSAAASAS